MVKRSEYRLNQSRVRVHEYGQYLCVLTCGVTRLCVGPREDVGPRDHVWWQVYSVLRAEFVALLASRSLFCSYVGRCMLNVYSERLLSVGRHVECESDQ